jgi:hypothetical protein
MKLFIKFVQHKVEKSLLIIHYSKINRLGKIKISYKRFGYSKINKNFFGKNSVWQNNHLNGTISSLCKI